MERQKALLVSTAAAVALVTAAVGYAASNLVKSPSDDRVGQLTATESAVPGPRPVQFVYDEVPVEIPGDTLAALDATPATAAVTPADDPGAAAATAQQPLASPSASNDGSDDDPSGDDDRSGYDDSEDDHAEDPEDDEDDEDDDHVEDDDSEDEHEVEDD